MWSDLAQQHRQNDQIRDTCASQRKALALQREAVRRQLESLPTNQDPPNATESNRAKHTANVNRTKNKIKVLRT